MKRLLLALALFGVALASALAATSTRGVLLNQAGQVDANGYTDLGAGPMLLGASGGAVIYQIGDASSSSAPTFVQQLGDRPADLTAITTHVFAKSVGAAPATAVVAAGSGVLNSTNSGSTYSLASGVNAAGSTAPVSSIIGASYIFACTAATWNSATAQLQALGPDGSTYLNVGTALSANGTLGVVLGGNATARVTVSGTPTGLTCNLS